MRADIRGQILSEEIFESVTKDVQVTAWVDELDKRYDDKISYAVGFSPPPPASTTTGTTADE